MKRSSNVPAPEEFGERLSFGEFNEAVSLSGAKNYFTCLCEDGAIDFDEFESVIRADRWEWFNENGSFKSPEILQEVVGIRFQLYFMLRSLGDYEEKNIDHETLSDEASEKKGFLSYEMRFDKLKHFPTLESFVDQVIDLLVSFREENRLMNKEEQCVFLESLRFWEEQIIEMPIGPLHNQFKTFLHRWGGVLNNEDGCEILENWIGRCVDKNTEVFDEDSEDTSGWGDVTGFEPPKGFKG